jgi:hypothetical protein
VVLKLAPLAGDTSEGTGGDVTSTMKDLEDEFDPTFPALSLACTRQYQTPSVSTGLITHEVAEIHPELRFSYGKEELSLTAT